MYNLRKIHILIIEDNPGDIILIKKSLQKYNDYISIDVVFDGEEAMKYLNKLGLYKTKKKPQLILIDLNLPKKNGLEILCEINENEIIKDIPTIMLSSSDYEGDIKKAYSLNLNSYIIKPKNFFELEQKMKNFCEYWLKTVSII